MFLIEFSKGRFIDGERIDFLSLKGGKITFTLQGDTENLYEVDSVSTDGFINHLQVINSNIDSVGQRWYELKGE